MWIATFLLLVCLSLGAQAAIAHEYQDEIPGHEGECLGQDKKFYKLGEHMPFDKPCTVKTCKGSAQPGSIHVQVQGCPTVLEKPGCQLKSDSTKNFPDCCGKLECGRH